MLVKKKKKEWNSAQNSVQTQLLAQSNCVIVDKLLNLYVKLHFCHTLQNTDNIYDVGYVFDREIKIERYRVTLNTGTGSLTCRC